MFCCTGTTMSEVQGNGNLMKATFTVLINDNNMKYLGIFLNVKVMKARRFSLDSTLFSTNAIRGPKTELTYEKILFCKNYENPFPSFLPSRSVTRLTITSDTPSPKKKSANNMIVSCTVISLTHLWQMMSQTKKKTNNKKADWE